ncbi:DUF91 domain-containing protein [candidate division WOR-3 bacterium]|nr:DUF91 domain-containing protein [candidate division WOR-3 bacterium]
MKPYKIIDEVSEQQLEELVRTHADMIEEGLSYLGHQKPAAGGRLDVLLVDSGKSLVVAELKVVKDDDMLIQAVDYYDDVSSHVEAYARIYQQTSQIDPKQQVRLFLIAPSFTPALVNRCKWFNIPIFLFTFQCLRFDGIEELDLVPVFQEQSIPSPPEVFEVPTVEEHLKYITDTKVKSKAKALLGEIEKWKPGKVTLDAVKSAISIKVNNRVFAYFYPRRKFYVLSTYNEQEVWTDYPINDDEDLSKIKPVMKAAMERRVK